MPAYNFMPRFAELVEKGIKPLTIRRARKRPTRIGDVLYLYTGMRTRRCRKLRTETCIARMPIAIFEDGIDLDGVRLAHSGAEQLARLDGFQDLEELTQFYRGLYGLPFAGVVIEWRPRASPSG